MSLMVRELKIEEDSIEKILEDLNVHPVGISIMKDKMVLRIVQVDEIDNRAANILKQEMLSLGGDCALPHGAYNLSVGKSKCLIIGTMNQYKKLIPKLKLQPFGLKDLAIKLEKLFFYEKINKTKIGDRIFEWGKRTYIMGIVNLTPDSFSGDGFYGERFIDNALNYATLLVEWGADIIDIGGESTRPNSEEVSLEEEKRRVIPVLQRMVKELDVPISVDTSKPEIAEEALHIGASMINDVWGLRRSEKMGELVKKYNIPVVIMHSIDGKGGKPPENYYKELVSDILEFFYERVNYALSLGIKRENIILDPGIGFGKGLKENTEIIKNINIFKSLGYPVLIGPSRKSFIGEILDLPPIERVEGTISSVCASIERGVDIVRVHDVKEVKRAVKVYDKITREKNENIS